MRRASMWLNQYGCQAVRHKAKNRPKTQKNSKVVLSAIQIHKKLSSKISFGLYLMINLEYISIIFLMEIL